MRIRSMVLVVRANLVLLIVSWAMLASAAEPTMIGEGILSTPADEFAGQSFMIIGCFGHPAGPGDSDLFVTKQSGGKWSEPQSLPVNTVAREYSPRLTPDGASLIFTSEQGTPTEKRDRPITYDELVQSATRTANGLGNLYSIPLRDLGIGGAR